MYPARGMMDHPGVPFYVMSWLALALAGYPTAPTDPGFFAALIEDVERYHWISLYLGALVGAAGVYLFVRVAGKLVPTGIAAIGLTIWLFSTPATLMMFMSPSIDSFAILINALFFAVLIRIANDGKLLPAVTVLAASAGAFAYLNKLSYIYVALALGLTGIVNLIFRRPGWYRTGLLCVLYGFVLVFVIVVVGFLVIGNEGFNGLLKFHKSVLLGSGLYGTGQDVIVSGSAVWRSIGAVPADRAYALYIALLGGGGLAFAGLVVGLKSPAQVPSAIIAIGSGLASVMSAAIVLKHYSLHYTAGVSATLPAVFVGGYLLLQDRGFRPPSLWAAVAAGASLLMASQTMPPLISLLASRYATTEMARADHEDIRLHLKDEKRMVEFVYKAPFAEYGEGFVVAYGSVPRLTEAYRKYRPKVISSIVDDLNDGEVGAYVLDKGYFPTAESIRTAANIALLSTKLVVMQDGDNLIELRTSFLVIRR